MVRDKLNKHVPDLLFFLLFSYLKLKKAQKTQLFDLGLMKTKAEPVAQISILLNDYSQRAEINNMTDC